MSTLEAISGMPIGRLTTPRRMLVGCMIYLGALFTAGLQFWPGV